MAERPNDRALRGRNDIVSSPGNIDRSSGGIAMANALAGAGRELSASMRRVGDIITRDVIRVEQAKGREAGMTGTTRLADGTIVPVAALREDNSIASEAFNAGVLQTAPNRLQSELLKNFDEIESATRGDIQGYLQGTVSYYEGLRANLPPELASDFDLQFQRLQSAGRRRQEAIMVRRQRDAMRFSNTTAVEALFNATQREAFNLLTVNPGTRDLSGEIVNDARLRLEALLAQRDPLGEPVHSAAERATIMDAFDESVVMAAALGGFERAPDKEGYIRQWLEGSRSNDEIGFDTIDKVETRLFTELGRWNRGRSEINRQLTSEAAGAVDVYQFGKVPNGIVDLRQRLIAADRPDLIEALDFASQNRDFMLSFVQQPLAAQRAALADFNALDTMTPQQATQAKAAQTAHTRALAALLGPNADPYGYAQRIGIFEETGTVTDFSAESLAVRVSQQSQIDETFGIRAPFLRPGEQAAILSTFNTGTPEDAVSIMATFASLPEDRLEQVATELSTENPAIARAFQLAGSQGGAETAQLIVEGYQLGLLPESGDIKPTAQAMRETIQNVFGDIGGTDPAVFQSFATTTEAIYLARLRERGQTVMNTGLLTEAAHLAAGGVMSNGALRGGVLRFGGKLVLPPAPGMTGDELNDLVLALQPGDLRAYSVDGGSPSFSDGRAFTPEMLTAGLGRIDNLSGFVSGGGFVLESTGAGRYFVRNRAGQFLLSSTGPYQIDLGQAWRDGIGRVDRVAP